MNGKAHGFTIVELLIVIVIIAILASITLVAYTGMQERAKDTKTITLANEMEKSIRIYQSYNRYLPDDWTCMGNSVNDFPVIPAQNIGLGVCERNMIPVDSTPWSSEFKTVPTNGQTRPTPSLLGDNVTVSSGALDMVKGPGDAFIRGVVYASIFEPGRAPNGKPGAFVFFGLQKQNCPNDWGYKTVGSVHMCAIRLTDDNYANEIFSATP